MRFRRKSEAYTTVEVSCGFFFPHCNPNIFGIHMYIYMYFGKNQQLQVSNHFCKSTESFPTFNKIELCTFYYSLGLLGPSTDHKSAAKYKLIYTLQVNGKRFIHINSYLLPSLRNQSPNFHMATGYTAKCT